jgi:uncharacterized protein YodC (DUF2158 family)
MVQVGDVVTLKSGGPSMTVNRVYTSNKTKELTVECAWFEETTRKERKEGAFSAAGVLVVQTEGDAAS